MNRFIMILFLFLSLSACTHYLNSGHQKSDDRHYLVVDVSISDAEKYDRFLALEQPILKKFGAHLEMEIRSEDEKKRHLIIIFPDAETVKHFVASSEFQKILPLAKTSSKSKVFHGKLIQ
ncbi:hypothetical protein MNBD_NITROSPIRAE01-2081 [hydrothermal vent metagenome]|uniref:DUF1330 domain-containing protein n=1 Tax=hydrothermal vent metagenome TaxID=652676 RepID=A0A3B1CNU4_9ZZZZ|nr:DUF1330 domain-containing protein [Candidatus Manganitrophaceae bacterium]